MQPTKWQIQLILTQKIIFCHWLKYLSEMDLSVVLTPALFDYHWLRRALHGALHRSCVAVVYPNLELICDFRPSKFSPYPSRPVPSRYPEFLSLPDPIPSRSQKPLPVSLCSWQRRELLSEHSRNLLPSFHLSWYILRASMALSVKISHIPNFWTIFLL